jgi:signal transduction histidine kinase
VIERVLQQLPFLRPFSAEQVQELARRGRVVSVPAGHVVCHEGESSDSMYVLLSGEVSVYRHDNIGRRIAIRQFRDGDHFGEVSLLDSKPRTATVVCVTDCDIFVLEQAAFREVLAADPSRVVSVLAAVADRVREQIEDHYEAELANLALEARGEVERHRALAQMVAGVAHELNTPLGISNTAVDMLANRLSRPDVAALFGSSGQTTRLLDNLREAATLAQRNIARAHKLIQDFKKISFNQLVDTPQTEDLAELVTSTVDLFKISARQAGLEIAIDNQLPAGHTEWIGYPGHLSQVVLNLLTNIERYACEPGAGGRAEITLTADNAQMTPSFTIAVRDHGPGIAPENQGKVFEPFFTTGRSKGGTGLGLSIVRNIVTNALNGEISLVSSPGHGATFQITFPQEVTDAQHELAHLDRR